MQRRCRFIRLLIVVAVLILLLPACAGGGETNKVTIKCDGCDMVQLWETSHATRVVGEVTPGSKGTLGDKAWNALEGTTFYYVAVDDKEGWVREENLEFE